MNPRRNLRLAAAAIVLVSLSEAAFGAANAIGVNTPAEALTRDRIAQLPSAQRDAWFKYLERSERQRQADKDAFQAELKRAGMTTPTDPPHGFAARGIPLDRDPAWYAGSAARHIADVVVSFQTPAGGWGKNMDMSKEERHPGERYGPNNVSRFLSAGDFDVPKEPDWSYIGTIDNDATITQIEFLAKVASAAGEKDGTPYRAAFRRGIDYLLAAQYPNGGWPQVWPLEGGYHDAITYNDSAMTQVMDILRHVADGKDEYAFVPKNFRARASASFERGMRCVLATQIVSGGKLTVWAQQDDPLTLAPVSARNYEMPSLSSGESASVMEYLMSLPKPTPAVVRAVDAAAAWFEASKVTGYGWVGERRSPARKFVPVAGAGPLWARYYSLTTGKPIFGDRDKTIHDDVNELSPERLNGYAWYGTSPAKALKEYADWKKRP